VISPVQPLPRPPGPTHTDPTTHTGDKRRWGEWVGGWGEEDERRAKVGDGDRAHPIIPPTKHEGFSRWEVAGIV
jgi:hypothetical protein